uniref:Uncharacterized protein n=1 Tax=Rhizophora mucronata TaxID=61149 RepID=A0A2P2PFH0_RHIMU
MQHYKDLE